jgi:hypothetical protein
MYKEHFYKIMYSNVFYKIINKMMNTSKATKEGKISQLDKEVKDVP